MDIIIYKNDDNSVGVLIPTKQALSFATIEQVAEKDVPYTLAYKIISKVDLPSNLESYHAWEWDSNTIPDGFGGENNTFDAELLAKYRGE